MAFKKVIRVSLLCAGVSLATSAQAQEADLNGVSHHVMPPQEADVAEVAKVRPRPRVVPSSTRAPRVARRTVRRPRAAEKNLFDGTWFLGVFR